MEIAKELISQYGYISIFCLLALGIVGLPVPDEILMSFVGYLASIHVLHYKSAVIASFCGAMSGMVLSYFLGKRIGKPLLVNYGKWIGLTPIRLQKVEGWFHKYGPWTIVFGYFIPGFRHVTCYLSGMSGMGTCKYLLFAGLGALIWCLIFITIGYYIGEIQE